MSRLLVRLYAIGIGQLLVIAIGAIAIGVLLASPPPLGRVDGFVADAASSRIEPVLGDPAALASKLDSLKREAGLAITVYDDHGAVLASNVEPPLAMDAPPKGPPPVGPNLGPPGPPPTLVRHLGTKAMVVQPEGHPPSQWPPYLTLACGLIVVGVGALFIRRQVVGPLDRIATASRALGRGDLRARTGVRRDDELGDVARSFDDMAERIERLVLAEKELLVSVSH